MEYLSGGVCFYIIDKSANIGAVDVYSEHSAVPVHRNRITANIGEEPLFVRDNVAVNIISKLSMQPYKSVYHTCSNVSPFGLKTTFEGSIIPTSDDDLEVIKSYDNIEYIPRNQISKGVELIDKYNVITGTLNADGAGGLIKGDKKLSVINKPKLLKPKQVCTLTYAVLNSFDNEIEAIHFEKYIQTQFVRFLINAGVGGAYMTNKTYVFVPLQDFTSNSDIDWSQPIHLIDQQLYKKYNLTQEEIDYIEKTIKPM